jgi:plasmid stability protein
MARLVVRDVGDEAMARARRHGRSVEEEVREILRNAVKDESARRKPLGSRLRERFAGIGLENALPELRGEVARPATFARRAAQQERAVSRRFRGLTCRMPGKRAKSCQMSRRSLRYWIVSPSLTHCVSVDPRPHPARFNSGNKTGMNRVPWIETFWANLNYTT